MKSTSKYTREWEKKNPEKAKIHAKKQKDKNKAIQGTERSNIASSFSDHTMYVHREIQDVYTTDLRLRTTKGDLVRAIKHLRNCG